MKKLLFVALGALLIASCSKDGSDIANVEPDAGSLAKTQGRPFTGSMSYNANMNADLPCNCGDFAPVGTFDGTGNLSHLGKTTSMIKPCVAPLIQDGNYVGFYVGVECAYFVAANGDSLYMYTHPYNLYFTPVGGVGVATVDFVGGTGRFKNATGQFTGTVTVGQTSATFTNLKGTIYY